MGLKNSCNLCNEMHKLCMENIFVHVLNEAMGDNIQLMT